MSEVQDFLSGLMKGAVDEFLDGLDLTSIWDQLVESVTGEVARRLTTGDFSTEARRELARLASRLDAAEASEADEILEELRALRDAIQPAQFEAMLTGEVPVTAAGFAVATLDRFLDEGVTVVSSQELLWAAIVNPVAISHLGVVAESFR